MEIILSQYFLASLGLSVFIYFFIQKYIVKIIYKKMIRVSEYIEVLDFKYDSNMLTLKTHVPRGFQSGQLELYVELYSAIRSKVDSLNAQNRVVKVNFDTDVERKYYFADKSILSSDSTFVQISLSAPESFIDNQMNQVKFIKFFWQHKFLPKYMIFQNFYNPQKEEDAHIVCQRINPLGNWKTPYIIFSIAFLPEN